jgi:deoxyadenosine/deoxycytidine kinase
MDVHDIFSRQFYDQGKLECRELCVLETLKDEIIRIAPVNRYIYIHAKSEELLDRIRLRDVKEEKEIDLDLIQSLEIRHEEWCKQNITSQDLIINSGNMGKQEVLEVAALWLRQIFDSKDMQE